MIKLTDEQKLLGETIAEFGLEQLAPKAEEIDTNETWNADAFKRMADLGLLGITVGESYGGSGLGCVEATLAMDKLGEHCASTTLSYLAHSILCVNNIHENASNAQKEKYLPRLVKGQWVGAMGMKVSPRASPRHDARDILAPRNDRRPHFPGTRENLVFISRGDHLAFVQHNQIVTKSKDLIQIVRYQDRLSIEAPYSFEDKPLQTVTQVGV